MRPEPVRGAAGIAGINWATMQGGDGFVVLQDPTDSRIVYSESQDGNMVRIDRVTGEIDVDPAAGRRRRAGAALELGHAARACRRTIRRCIYAAANKVFRSPNRGLNWVAVSPDLTTATPNREDIVTMGVKGSDIRISKNDGIQAWPTIVSFAESPKRAGVVYAGTDDGHLQVSRDGGTIVDGRHRQDAGRAEGHLGVARSCRRGSTRAPSTRRSTATARTTSRPTST